MRILSEETGRGSWISCSPVLVMQWGLEMSGGSHTCASRMVEDLSSSPTSSCWPSSASPPSSWSSRLGNIQRKAQSPFTHTYHRYSKVLALSTSSANALLVSTTTWSSPGPSTTSSPPSPPSCPGSTATMIIMIKVRLAWYCYSIGCLWNKFIWKQTKKQFN